MLYQPVKNLWETEGFFSANSREIAMSHEDSKCLKSLIEETNLVRGKYQVPILWEKGKEIKTSEKLLNQLWEP